MIGCVEVRSVDCHGNKRVVAEPRIAPYGYRGRAEHSALGPATGFFLRFSLPSGPPANWRSSHSPPCSSSRRKLSSAPYLRSMRPAPRTCRFIRTGRYMGLLYRRRRRAGLSDSRDAPTLATERDSAGPRLAYRATAPSSAESPGNLNMQRLQGPICNARWLFVRRDSQQQQQSGNTLLAACTYLSPLTYRPLTGQGTLYYRTVDKRH